VYLIKDFDYAAKGYQRACCQTI